MSGGGHKDAGNAKRYPSMNLAQSYKGGPNDYRYGQRSGSMQSLGKVSNSRRMPAPVQLESLKSSHGDYRPSSVSLVPQGGGGWTNNTGGDKKEEDDKKKTKMEKKEEGWKTTNPIPERSEDFHADFPSLDEQDKLPRKENRDDAKKRQYEDKDRPLSERHSPSQYPDHPRGQDVPPMPYPPVHSYRLPPSHRGGSGFHPSRPPPRPGDYQPPSGGHYPPSQNYRYHHRHMPYPPPPNYVSTDPYDIDPYHLPPKSRDGKRPPDGRREDTGRPPTVKADDLKQMEEDDDEGWAGHHEDVDYSVDVVFEDSSDEEIDRKKKEETKKSHPPPFTRQDSPNDPTSKDEHPPSNRSAHSAPQGYPREPGPPYYPPYHDYPYYSAPSHWYPPYSHPPPRGGQYEQGRHHSKQRRFGDGDHDHPGRGGHYNFVPKWDQNYRHGNESREWESNFDNKSGPPRVLKKEARSSPSTETPPSTAEKEVGDEDAPQSPDIIPQNRSVPKKIMMREFVNKDTDAGRGSPSDQNQSLKQGRSDYSSDKSSGQQSQSKSKPAWGSVPSPVPHPLNNPDTVSSVEFPERRPSPEEAKVYDIHNRGPISAKTLYEPEGRTSEAKFEKYQRMSSIGEISGGQRGRLSSSGSGKNMDKPDKPVLTTQLTDSTTPQEEGTRELEPAINIRQDTKKVPKRNDSKASENLPHTRERDRRPQRGSEGTDFRQDRREKLPQHKYDSDERDRRRNPNFDGPPRKGRGRGRGSRSDYSGRGHPERDEWEESRRDTDSPETYGGRSASQSKPTQSKDPPQLEQKNKQESRQRKNSKPELTSSSNTKKCDQSSSDKVPFSSTREQHRSDLPKRTGSDHQKADKSEQNVHSHTPEQNPDSYNSERNHTSDHRYPDHDSEQIYRNRHSNRQNSEQNSDQRHVKNKQSNRQYELDRPGHQASTLSSARSQKPTSVKSEHEPVQHVHHSESQPESTRYNPQETQSHSGPVRNRQHENQPDPDPMRNRQPNSDPTRNRQPDPDPIRNRQPDTDPTRNRQPDSDPTRNRRPDSDPTRNRQPDSDPTRNRQPDSDPTRNRRPDSDPTRNRRPDLDSNRNRRPDSDPIRNKRPDSDLVRNRSHEGQIDSGLVRNKRYEGQPESDPVRNRRHEGQTDSDPVRNKRYEGQPKSDPVRSRRHEGQADSDPVRNRRHEDLGKYRDGRHYGRGRYEEEDDRDWDNKQDGRRRSGRGNISNRGERRPGDGPRNRRQPQVAQIDDEDSYYYSQSSTDRSSQEPFSSRDQGYGSGSFPSRTFDSRGFRGGRRGGGRGRGRKGPSIGQRRGNETEPTVQKTTNFYEDLDDIDSASDWEEDELDIQVTTSTQLLQESLEKGTRHSFHEQKDRGSNIRQDQNERSRRQDVSQFSSGQLSHRDPQVSEGSYFKGTDSHKTAQKPLISTTPSVPQISSVINSNPPLLRDPKKSDGLLPTPKLPVFDKYDVNSSGVFVIDYHTHDEEEETREALPDTEGFTVVEYKRDKQKDQREKKRKLQENRRSEDNRHRGSSSHGRTSTEQGSVWNQAHSRSKTSDVWSRSGGGRSGEAASTSAGENWPPSSGRYGAIGEKPSREHNIERNPANSSTDVKAENDYRLFDNSTRPFPLSPSQPSSLSGTGQLLQAAIDLTMTEQFPKSQVTTDTSSLNPILTHPINASESASELPQSQLNPTPSSIPQSTGLSLPVPDSTTSSSDIVSNQGKESERRSGIVSKRPKTIEQRYYTPPGARQDDIARGPKSGTRPTSSTNRPLPKSEVQKSQHTKVMLQNEESSSRQEKNRADHQRDTEDGLGLSCGNKTGHSLLEKEQLQQHQRGCSVAMATTTAPGCYSESDENYLCIVTNEQLLSEKTNNEIANQQQQVHFQRLIPSPVLSSKFGTVSYASALKSKNGSREGGQSSAGSAGSLRSGMTSQTSSRVSTPGIGTSDEWNVSKNAPLHVVVMPTKSSPEDENQEGVFPLSNVGLVLESVILPGEDSYDHIEGEVTMDASRLSPRSPARTPKGSPHHTTSSLSYPQTNSPRVSTTDPMTRSSPLSDTYTFTPHTPLPIGTPSTPKHIKTIIDQDSLRPSSVQDISLAQYPNSPQSHDTSHDKDNVVQGPVSGSSSPAFPRYSPLTRTSSAPSELRQMGETDRQETGLSQDSVQSLHDDNDSTGGSKSSLNITANEFVPKQQPTTIPAAPDNPRPINNNKPKPGKLPLNTAPALPQQSSILNQPPPYLVQVVHQLHLAMMAHQKQNGQKPPPVTNRYHHHHSHGNQTTLPLASLPSLGNQGGLPNTLPIMVPFMPTPPPSHPMSNYHMKQRTPTMTGQDSSPVVSGHHHSHHQQPPPPPPSLRPPTGAIQYIDRTDNSNVMHSGGLPPHLPQNVISNRLPSTIHQGLPSGTPPSLSAPPYPPPPHPSATHPHLFVQPNLGTSGTFQQLTSSFPSHRTPIFSQATPTHLPPTHPIVMDHNKSQNMRPPLLPTPPSFNLHSVVAPVAGTAPARPVTTPTSAFPPPVWSGNTNMRMHSAVPLPHGGAPHLSPHQLM